MAGYRARAAQNELAVDNFFTVFFFNNFNTHGLKSMKSSIFRDFSWITHASCG
jgi:hypothetical protein